MIDESDPALLTRLEAAVQSLPKLRRQVFLAVRVEGKSYGEVAQATGLSVAQVERHVARALLQIDDHLHRVEASPFRRRWRRIRRR